MTIFRAKKNICKCIAFVKNRDTVILSLSSKGEQGRHPNCGESTLAEGQTNDSEATVSFNYSGVCYYRAKCFNIFRK